MSISENKRVVGLASVMGLAVAGLVYFGYSKNQEFEATQQKLQEINDRFEEYSSAAVTPTKQNVDNLSAAFKQVSAVGKEMEDSFKKYASFCQGEGQGMSAQELQKTLLGTIDATKKLADEKGVTVAGPAADLGMGAYKTQNPKTNEVPYRHFLLKAVQRVTEDVINSGAASLEKVYCAELPAEADLDNKKSPAYFPLRFEVAFEARRGTLPQVLNKIMADKEYFITITGLAVQGKDNLPPMAAYSAPGTASEMVGDDLGTDSGEAGSPSAVRMLATRLTGRENETARVHMTMQVMYFNPDSKAKKNK
ncbi:MAG: Amuc_1100 family pilus-like protein [Akkermansia sp.]|nr:Amuc_1100 family pilus-like protein [Akkermansia sp.]